MEFPQKPRGEHEDAERKLRRSASRNPTPTFSKWPRLPRTLPPPAAANRHPGIPAPPHLAVKAKIPLGVLWFPCAPSGSQPLQQISGLSGGGLLFNHPSFPPDPFLLGFRRLSKIKDRKWGIGTLRRGYRFFFLSILGQPNLPPKKKR